MTMRIKTLLPTVRLGLAILLATTAGCDYFVPAETRYERAQDLVAKGEHRRALIELKNALQKQPDMEPARILLAEVALWLGDPASAESELRKASSAHDPTRYAELEMRIQLALGRFQPMLDQLDDAGSALPKARRSFYRGSAIMGLKQPKTAEAHFRDAIAEDSEFVQAKVALAESLAAQNDVPAAVELTTKIARDHPESAHAWHAHGLLLARRAENDEALAALERASGLSANQLDFVREVGLLAALTDLYLAKRDIEAARASSAQLTRLASGSAIAAVNSSRVLMATEEFSAAAAELRRVVNANPSFSQGRFLLGVALLAQGNLEQAATELSAVVEQVPEHLEARQLLAQVRLRQEDPDGALRVLVPALQSGSEDERLSLLVSAARAQSGGASQAIEMLERALQNAPDNEGLQLQLASAYMQAGDAEKALALLRRPQSQGAAGIRREALLLQAITNARGNAAAKAEVDARVAAHPDDPRVVSLAAAFYAHLGDTEGARRLLVEGLKKRPNDAVLLYAYSQLELSSGRQEGARAALQRLLQIDEHHSVARLTLAQLDLASGNVDAARVGLELVRKDEPQAPLPRFLLARIALSRDDSAQASALIEEAIKQSPMRPDIHNAAGVLYLENGRFDQAMDYFRAGLKISPESEVLWLNMGRAQQALGQESAARQSFERALIIKPDWLPAEGALAFLDLRIGSREAALDRLERLRLKSPKDPAVLILSGDVHSALREYAEAARAFEAAAQIQPSATLAFKAYEARRAGQLPKPTAPIEQWLASNPGDLVSRSVLAGAYAMRGERRLAIQQYEQIVDAQSGHVPSLNNLAWLYFEANDPRAEATARKAHALAPGMPEVVDTLGWILVESGRVEEGVALLKSAAAAPKTSPDITYHYAAALAKSGAVIEARAELERLLEQHATFPTRDAAQQLREQLHTDVGSGS
jgi:putative PEP-CTERM system TPR-repeat lipoprotein